MSKKPISDSAQERWVIIALSEDDDDRLEVGRILSLLESHPGVTGVSKVETTVSFEVRREDLNMKHALGDLVRLDYVTAMWRIWENSPVAVIVIESVDPFSVAGEVLDEIQPLEDTVWFADDVGENKKRIVARILEWYDKLPVPR